MENKEFKRFDWEQYKELLKHYNYTEEQIASVKEVRENPENELMSPEQFDFLWQQGIIRRTRKLKSKRSLLVTPEGKILYLDHYFKAYNFCGHFLNQDEEI